jgi:hypothetical protein
VEQQGYICIVVQEGRGNNWHSAANHLSDVLFPFAILDIQDKRPFRANESANKDANRGQTEHLLFL